MRKLLTLLLIVYTASAESAPAEDTPDLKRRVQQLEQQIQSMQKSNDAFVESITKTVKEDALAQESGLELENQFRSKLQTSGYADVEFRHSSKANSHPGFRIHHFSVIFTKEIDSNWSTFSEVEYEDAPQIEFTPGSPDCQGNCSGAIILEAMNVDYTPNEYFGLRFGRFFTPAGIWSVDHYPPFVTTQERPLHIRNIFPQLIDGAMIHGSIPIVEAFLDYDVYLGNGEGNSGSGDNNDEKSLGFRAALQLPWLTQFELGTSLLADTLSESDGSSTAKVVAGMHLRVRGGPVAVQMEVANGNYQPDGTGIEFTKLGYYTQLGVDVMATTIGYRYDYFEDYDKPTATSIDLTRHTLYANYRVHKNVVTKLEFHNTTQGSGTAESLTIGTVAYYLGD